MNFAQLSTNVVNYVKNNSASLVGTAATAAGWSAAAAVGGKGAVVGVCLVGGGMFATLIAHEVLTATAKVTFGAIKGIRAGIKSTFKEPVPEGLAEAVRAGRTQAAASGGNDIPM